MGVRIMSHWIEGLAIREKQRRSETSAFFSVAFGKFLETVKAIVIRDLAEFRKHFPDERIDRIEIVHGRHLLEVKRSSGPGGPMLSLKISCDPIAGLFQYECTASPNLSKALPATVEDGVFKLNTEGAAVTLDELVAYFLAPVLFPGLSSHPDMLGLLQKQFAPR
jgi:hypothetical protein